MTLGTDDTFWITAGTQIGHFCVSLLKPPPVFLAGPVCHQLFPQALYYMSGTVPQPCACKVNDTRMLLMRLHLGACLWKERPS
jgi:hypothetical protein